MLREVDVRDHTVNRADAGRVQVLRARAPGLGAALPGAAGTVTVERVSPVTGNAAGIRSAGGAPVTGDLTEAALRHVRAMAPVLGGEEGAGRAEFRPVGPPLFTSSGAAAVHLEQVAHGLPFFQSSLTVRFGPDRVLSATAGTCHTPAGLPGAVPVLAAADALAAATRHLAEPDEGVEGQNDQFGNALESATVDTTHPAAFAPQTDAEDTAAPERTAFLRAPQYTGPVRSSLTWFGLGRSFHLGWGLDLVIGGGTEHYRMVVDAHTGVLLYCKLVTRQVRARARVAFPDPDTPRALLDMPQPPEACPFPVPGSLPAGFPREDWVDTDRTEGNNALVRMTGGDPAVGAPQPGRAGQPVVFDPADDRGHEQLRVTASYLCNYMHDCLYLLGFTEQDRNFQERDALRGGRAGGRMVVDIVPGHFPRTAGMSFSVDGRSPVMRLGPDRPDDPGLPPRQRGTGRHTALDAGVVFHEYGHGVTGRLVGGGGRDALNATLSSALDEGWADYLACAVLDDTVVGRWLSGSSGGIRTLPYDADNTLEYGDIGIPPFTEAHTVGEIWAAALMDADRALGRELTAQLVVDGLKLTPAMPVFPEARDAFLQALSDKAAAEHWPQDTVTDRRRRAWEAFARHGLGFLAEAGPADGWWRDGIRGDKSMPPDLVVVLPPAPVPPPEPDAHRMVAGDRLAAGESCRSRSGAYSLIYQGDGNLVLYRDCDRTPLWNSRTAGTSPGACLLGEDGDLVVHDAELRPVWHSRTAGNPGGRLELRDDGNLVLYAPDGRALWATHTGE